MPPSAHPLAQIDRRIGWLNTLVTLLGASVTFFYLSAIDPAPLAGSAIQALNVSTLLMFAVIMLGLMYLGGVLSTRIVGPVDAWRKRIIAGASVTDVPAEVRRMFLEYPARSALVTFGMWVIAGGLFSVLTFSAGLRSFVGIVGVGGVLVTGIYYFACDVLWRPAIALLLPDGQLRPIGGARISVLRRLGIAFFLIGPYPLGVLTYLSLSRASDMLSAPDPQIVLNNLVILELFILGVSLLTGTGLVIFFSRGITGPLRRLQDAMRQVAHGNLAVRVPVTTTDELGYVSEHFNQMTDGLRQTELLRNLLNLYVSPEVAREAIEHGTQLGGKLVDCTVLFSDIRNFTGLSEALPPDQLIELLNRYMSAMVAVVVEQGGMVNKFGGDSLLAVFGTPINPADDHAARAVRTAENMLRSLEQFNREQASTGGVSLRIGIGIASGPVVVGNVGGQNRLEYTVIGDTVNLAARLQTLTKDLGRDVLINAATHQGAHRVWPLAAERLPDVAIRGKSEPVAVYAVTTPEPADLKPIGDFIKTLT